MQTPCSTLRQSKPRNRGFTLIELMVVIGIIALLASIVAPAVGPMLASNEAAQVSNTVSGLLAKTQAMAVAQSTPMALRFERAFEMVTGKFPNRSIGYSLMLKDYSTSPVPQAHWLDHQQVRILTYTSKDNPNLHQEDQSVTSLPKSTWVAPDFVLSNPPLAPTIPVLPNGTATPVSIPDLQESNLFRTWPPVPSGWYWPNPVPFNQIENFLVAFDKNGELVKFPASKTEFTDQTQAEYNPSTGQLTDWPHIDHPCGSAMGLLAYDRQAYENIPPTDSSARRLFFGTNGRPIFFNRFTGGVIQEPSK